jgi:hypothetical protein
VTVESTRRDVLALWRRWPDRGKHPSKEAAALPFYLWLRKEHDDRFAYWSFSSPRSKASPDPYQVVKSWLMSDRMP